MSLTESKEPPVRYVKTPDEIRQIQAVYARPHFLRTRSLTVIFETTRRTIEALLPPPLEPTPETLGTAWIGDIGSSNGVGPFLGAGVYLRARYKDLVGNYCLTMPMSTAQAVTFGRELYGEPKKLAKITFDRQREHVWGSVERHEIRYLSLRGRLDEPASTGRIQTSSFHFKFDAANWSCETPPTIPSLTSTSPR
jgi:acetoacetate decarboxylase